MKNNDIQWLDIRSWGVEGKGWTNMSCYYERLPKHAKQTLPQLWEMSRHCTGFSCDFETDATCIQARWNLRLEQLDEPNMNRATFSGLDLYAFDKGVWRWVGAGIRHQSRRAKDTLAEDLGAVNRRYRLYLPMRNPVTRVEIGIPRGAKFKPLPPRTVKPVVYYGSSIIHGAYASRAGVVHSSVLGRWLDRPVINLGFSGLAKMDESMAHLLAELDPAVFVIDPLPNMDPALVKERAEKFLRILCAARPKTPVVMVEDFPRTHAWCRPSFLMEHQAKWKAFSRVYKSLGEAGFANIHYVQGRHSIGDDNTGTVDGIHPNDTGYERLAKNLFPLLNKIIRHRN